ncbi:N-6 DNA methylase, partial [Candidatus Roizmanbacteria bacterium]|nr:N-6 DNA methylase [Candidatus Roizmanbacteria bacterium]
MLKTQSETSILNSILNNSQYGLNIFKEEEIIEFSNSIFIKDDKPYINCFIREKEIQLKPEEIVRQLFLRRLVNEYGYPKKSIKLEHLVRFGRELDKAADIVIFDKDRPTVEYVIVEIKKPNLKDGKEQLKSYCNGTGAPIGIWTNGGQISFYNRKDPNYFEDITDIPRYDQTLQDVLTERFTLKNLILKDKIPNEGKSLKTIIQDMEDEVLANAGVDVFEEVFKLIFTKLYDEYRSAKDKEIVNYFLKGKNIPMVVVEPSSPYLHKVQNSYEILKDTVNQIDDSSFRVLQFRNNGQSEGDLKKKIQSLFDEAKEKWDGVFEKDSKITLSPSHLSVCVAGLQDVKLFNSNLQVIDEAFEYLISKSQKGEKGQYFTPRHVIDMCVKMLNPKKGEYMIDTAAGSCGFTVHTIFWLTGHLFTNAEITPEEKEYVLRVFGIDFDDKVVRVARTLNLIAGDGETNVLHLNTLDYERWNENLQNQKWLTTYGKGFQRLQE